MKDSTNLNKSNSLQRLSWRHRWRQTPNARNFNRQNMKTCQKPKSRMHLSNLLPPKRSVVATPSCEAATPSSLEVVRQVSPWPSFIDAVNHLQLINPTSHLHHTFVSLFYSARHSLRHGRLDLCHAATLTTQQLVQPTPVRHTRPILRL